MNFLRQTLAQIYRVNIKRTIPEQKSEGKYLYFKSEFYIMSENVHTLGAH